MTVAFWNEKDYVAKLSKLFKEKKEPERGNRYIEVHRNTYRSCAPFAMAARMVRYHCSQYMNFKSMLADALKNCGLGLSVDEVLAGMPMIVPAKAHDKLRVFVNVPITRPEEDKISNVCWAINESVLSGFFDIYKAELDNHTKAIAWETPRKAWSRIKKYEEMPIQRVISRFTRLQELKVPEKTILAVGTDIAEQRKPMELTYVTTPEQSVEMYATGPSSCMDHRKGNADGAWNVLLKNNHHPTSLFLYHPYIQGVFAKMKGAVVARTFLYEKENGKKYFGRVYAASAKHQQVFEQNLRSAGYVKIGPDKTDEAMFKRSCVFSVPGLTLNHKEYYMPLPYCDNLHNSICAEFNQETKEFTVSCFSDKDSNVNFQCAAGLISGSSLVGRKCDNCRQPARDVIETHDGHVYCGRRCAITAGYLYAHRDDGVRIWIKEEKGVTIQDYYSGEWYTNEAAARARGLLPVILNLYEDSEDRRFSGCGKIIKHGEDYFRFYTDDTDREGQFNDAVKSGELEEVGRFRITNERCFELKTTDKVAIKIKQQKVVEYDNDEWFVEEDAA